MGKRLQMGPFLTLRIALRALARNRLRTILTMLGIVIGVAAVIAMMSIGNGAKHAVESRIASMGTNTVHVFPGYRRGRHRGSDGQGIHLKEADWKAVARLPEVVDSCPMVRGREELVYGSSNWSCPVTGTTPSYIAIRSWPIAEGRMFTESEVHAGSNVIVLGQEVRRELFGSAPALNANIRVDNLPFRVVGVLSEKGSSGFGSSKDNTSFIPYTTAMRKLRGEDRLSYLTVTAKSMDHVKRLDKLVCDFLNDRHHLVDEENGGFRAFNQAEVTEMASASTQIFAGLLLGIASISLLVGGIGIMNIMLVSVTERTREIGIRMAVGARGRDILSQFLLESLVLSIGGGAVGVALGVFVSGLIADKAGWPSIVTEASIVLAFGASVAVGVFFGFYPALSASKLDPIQALRHE